MKKMMKKFKNERGLTLVELLAVIVILAIVAIIAFVFIGGVIENTKKDTHISNAQQIIAAAKLHESTGGEISDDGMTIKELQTGQYLDKILDPWTKTEYAVLESAKVIKDESEFKITGFNDSDNNCKIEATEDQLNTGDRDTLCKTD